MHRASAVDTPVSARTISSSSAGRVLTRWAPWLSVSYNCQALTARRPLETILTELSPDLLGLQGTRRAPPYVPERRPEHRPAVEQQSVQGYRVWRWARPFSASATDPRGVSLAIRSKRCGSHPRITTDQPCDVDLQGRAGYVRIRASGQCDFACIVLYLPCGSSMFVRRVYSQLLEWAAFKLASLPARCSPVVFADANARLGSHPVDNASGEVQIGTYGAKKTAKQQQPFCVLLSARLGFK